MRTLDDLADLDNEELIEYLGQHGLTDDTEAGDIIMAARAHWFADEDIGEDANQDTDVIEQNSDAARLQTPIIKSCIGSRMAANMYHHWQTLRRIG